MAFRWNQEADDYIREKYHEMKMATLAAKLSRMMSANITPASVRRRIKELKLNFKGGAPASKTYILRMNICGEPYDVSYVSFKDEEGRDYFVCVNTRKPRYATSGRTLEEAKISMRQKIAQFRLRRYGKKNPKKYQSWDWEKVNELRRRWNNKELTLKQVIRRYGYYGREIIYNKEPKWHDENYTPLRRPKRRFKRKEPKLIIIFENEPPKTFKEWSLDKRCKTTHKNLIQRYTRHGIRGPALLEAPRANLELKSIKITLLGEKKSLRQWGLDDRCGVNAKTLYRRYNQGWGDERILMPMGALKRLGLFTSAKSPKDYDAPEMAPVREYLESSLGTC
jgi:hypothetical protein